MWGDGLEGDLEQIPLIGGEEEEDSVTIGDEDIKELQ